MADSSSLSGAACRPLSEIDAALIRYEELWSSGTYYGLEGDPVASFSPDDRTIRITQNFDGSRLALVPEALRLLVLVAPLCLPLAGLTGIVASSSG